jgi:8-oxo-dGTP diphosphatase
MEDYSVTKIKRIGDSVLIKGKSDNPWVYISSTSKNELLELTNYIDEEDKYFAVIEDWMIPYLMKNKKIDWKMTCMKLYLNDEVVIEKPKYKASRLSYLDSSHIYENSSYKDYISVEYIKDRISKGIGLGIYDNDKLVAWLITQDDGAMGFLTVLKDYRRKGYAHSLTLSMIHKLREMGKLPFVHIEESNSKSMNLALKMGFTRYGRISWIKTK